jgi:hypothetical protein
MTGVFICYSRESQAIVKALADDIGALGHDAWYDQELSGGQAWWDVILAQIRECDVLIAALSPASLTSVACRREIDYARDVGRSVLPVLVAEGVSMALLPPALSTIQYVDYRAPDRSAALRLARALSAAPPAKALPSPLPPPPDVPLSYLGGLRQQIEVPTPLGFAEQSALLIGVKRSLDEPENAGDGRALLRLFRKRHDLLATIADEIDELLTERVPPPLISKRAPAESHPDQRPPLEGPRDYAARPLVTPDTRSKPRRLMGASIGGTIGFLAGLIPILGGGLIPQALLFPVAGGAIAGAISGADQRSATTAVVCAVLGWVLNAVLVPDEGWIMGVFVGAPVGAILGAAASAPWKH